MTNTNSSIEACTIKPTNKYNRYHFPTLSLHYGLDQVGAPVHISNHRFYRRPEHLKEQDIINILKSSLAEALELYPPVAGTVRANEKGEPYIALDAEGAPFMIERRDLPFTGETDDISPRPVLLLPTPSSVLAVKVTLFSCGTVAVASSLHHYLADLRGFLDFLVIWAKIARGETIDLETVPQDWSHTPSRFYAELQTKDKNSLEAPRGYSLLDSTPTTLPMFSSSSEVQTWKISESALAKLKKDFTSALQESSADASWISSGDALASLLWGVITRARQSGKESSSSSDEYGTETIAMAADGRERSPNKNMIDGRYLGNFNILFLTTVPRADLLSPDAKSASRVAQTIRTSLNEQLSPQAIADRLQFMEVPEHAGRIIWNASVAFTNWCRFDLEGEDMNFGWGKPFDATGGEGELPPGYVRLQQRRSTGEVTAIITVEKEGAHAMRNDALLNKYATFMKTRE